ncbi:hypothetical protein [Sphingomonas aquatilis]
MRQTRSALLGAVLALVAMLGLVMLSSWHNAMVHDDDPVHLVSVEHDHGSSNQADPDGPIHVLAHATGQWIPFADVVPSSVQATTATRTWLAGIYHLRGSIEPSGLLRPPRG